MPIKASSLSSYTAWLQASLFEIRAHEFDGIEETPPKQWQLGLRQSELP